MGKTKIINSMIALPTCIRQANGHTPGKSHPCSGVGISGKPWGILAQPEPLGIGTQYVESVPE